MQSVFFQVSDVPRFIHAYGLVAHTDTYAMASHTIRFINSYAAAPYTIEFTDIYAAASHTIGFINSYAAAPHTNGFITSYSATSHTICFTDAYDTASHKYHPYPEAPDVYRTLQSRHPSAPEYFPRSGSSSIDGRSQK